MKFPLVTLTLIALCSVIGRADAAPAPSAPPGVKVVTTLAQAVRNSARPRGFGFVTAWAGSAGKVLLDVRLRPDGTTVVRYRGKRKKAGKLVAFTGSFRGKLTPNRRRLSNAYGFISFPKAAPSSGRSAKAWPGSEWRTKGFVWGGEGDRLKFSFSAKGFDVPLVGFDVPLVGFDVPLVGFDEPTLFRDVKVSALGGGLRGVAVTRTLGGKTYVTYVVNPGGKKSIVRTLVGTGGKRLRFGDSAGALNIKAPAARTGTNPSTGVKSALRGTLRVRVGTTWKTASLQLEQLVDADEVAK